MAEAKTEPHTQKNASPYADGSPVQNARAANSVEGVRSAFSANGVPQSVFDRDEDPDVKSCSSPFASSPIQEAFNRHRDDEMYDDDDEAARQKAVSHALPQRMVSWQDEVHGQDLYTVREFEPSESGVGHEAEESGGGTWETERKTCCAVM